MKHEIVKSSAGYTVAARVIDDNWSDFDTQSFIDLIREYGVLFWKRSSCTTQQWVDFQLKVGYAQINDMWCTDPEFPTLYRVTNKPLSDSMEGLFSHGELDWHCNILFTPDSEEVVGLRGVTIVPGSQTICANSLPYWTTLDKQTQQLYKTLFIQYTNQMPDTYENKLAHYMLPSKEAEDFQRERISTRIESCVNWDNSAQYPSSRFSKTGALRLVPNHPLGMQGIYFPHLNMSSILDSNKQARTDHQSIYESIKREYIDSNQFHYAHDWEEGDILMMEQLTGVHRRNNVWEEQSLDPTQHLRELQRSCWWYKSEWRQHFKRCL